MNSYTRRVIKLHLRAMQEPTSVACGLQAIKSMLLERKYSDLNKDNQ